MEGHNLPRGLHGDDMFEALLDALVLALHARGWPNSGYSAALTKRTANVALGRRG